MRTLLARVLQDAGYQVCEAGNGRQGLERFHAQPVDLVITDLEMPEKDAGRSAKEFAKQAQGTEGTRSSS